MVYTENLLALLRRPYGARGLTAAIFLVGLLFAIPTICHAEASADDSLRLSMISGDGKHLLATINGETFSVGEKHKVMAGKRKVPVQCLDIRDGAVVVKVEGENLAKELAFGKRAKWVATPTNAAPAQPAPQPMPIVVESEPADKEVTSARGGWRSPLASVLGLGAVVVIGLLYIAFCRSCAALCRRAGAPAPVWVWLPIFRLLALFKAVGLSPWWIFLGLFIPFVTWGACIVCCIRLCDTFRCSRLLVIPMLLPFFHWLAFMYLARASASEEQETALPQKFAFEVPND